MPLVGVMPRQRSFVVVDEAEKITQISQILGRENIATAPAIILCIINKSPESVVGNLSFEIEDCAAARNEYAASNYRVGICLGLDRWSVTQ